MNKLEKPVSRHGNLGRLEFQAVLDARIIRPQHTRAQYEAEAAKRREQYRTEARS